MPTHHHSHTHVHAPGERHPHAEVSPSLLRFSAIERVGIAFVLSAAMWLAVAWAVGWIG